MSPNEKLPLASPPPVTGETKLVLAALWPTSVPSDSDQGVSRGRLLKVSLEVCIFRGSLSLSPVRRKTSAPASKDTSFSTLVPR